MVTLIGYDKIVALVASKPMPIMGASTRPWIIISPMIVLTALLLEIGTPHTGVRCLSQIVDAESTDSGQKEMSDNVYVVVL